MGNTYTNLGGPDVVSDKSIKVEKIGIDAEIWDGYKKTYRKNIFQQDIFDPPHTVTNPTSGEKVDILCRCRDMIKMMNENRPLEPRPIISFGGDGVSDKVLSRKINPACWEDTYNPISDLSGGTTYKISYRDPQFYVLATNPTGLVDQSIRSKTEITFGKTKLNITGGRRTRKIRKKLKSKRR